MSGESIKSAIARKINNKFKVTSGSPLSTEYPTVYKEKIVQNMKKPCFFVWQMNVSQEKQMRNNYWLVFEMNVRYHPVENDVDQYRTLASVGTKLLSDLSSIDVPISEGGEIRTRPVVGKQMNFRIEDGVLQLFVTYNIKVKMHSEEAGVLMQELLITEQNEGGN